MICDDGRHDDAVMEQAKKTIDLTGRLRTMQARLDESEAEKAALERDLAAARQRIEELEAARDAALDRIGWAIDSLHNEIEEEA